MLENSEVRAEIEAALTALVDSSALPENCKIAFYAGQIDLIRMVVEAGSFPAILINWQEDQGDDHIVEERDDVIIFNLLICTDSAEGQGEALSILDTLKENFYGVWTGENNLRIFDVHRGPARSLFNLKRKQIISQQIRFEE